MQLRGPCLQNLILREPSRSLKGTVIVENSDTFNMLYIDYAILFISFWQKLITHRSKAGLSIECFHMTSRRPYWCPKTTKRRPSWCPKPVLWELNSLLTQTLSFVPINLHRYWPSEWKHSILQCNDRVG